MTSNSCSTNSTLLHKSCSLVMVTTHSVIKALKTQCMDRGSRLVRTLVADYAFVKLAAIHACWLHRTMDSYEESGGPDFARLVDSSIDDLLVKLKWQRGIGCAMGSGKKARPTSGNTAKATRGVGRCCGCHDLRSMAY